MPYVLRILTHGRRYQEEYDSLEEAIAAAVALEHEPRERAESITLNGEPYLDRAALEARIQARPEQRIERTMRTARGLGRA